MNEALVLLVLIWAVLLVPSALRSRKASPHATVGGFERAMDVLRTAPGTRGSSREMLVPADPGRLVDHEGTTPPGHRIIDVASHDPGMIVDVDGLAPRPMRPEDPMVVRRRTRFVRSLVATAATLLLAVIVGGWLWLAFFAALLGTAGYAALLRRIKLQRDEARRVVADLELYHDEPVELERVAVGGGWESGTVRLRRWDA